MPPTSVWLTIWLPPVSHWLAVQYTTGASILPEVGRHDPEHHHELRCLLPGGEAQGRWRGIQHIVLLGAEIVRQDPVGISAERGLIDDLVAAGDVPGAGDDFLQVRESQAGAPSSRKTRGMWWSCWRCR